MRLFIAEKPSLGRAIADVLPKPHQRGEGFIKCGNEDIVTWCVGHLLEQAEPDAYDPKYKQWRLEHLPIIPEKERHQAAGVPVPGRGQRRTCHQLCCH